MRRRVTVVLIGAALATAAVTPAAVQASAATSKPRFTTAYTARIALGSTKAVRAGGASWGRDTGVAGGRIVTNRFAGAAGPLLAKSRVGTVTTTLKVPFPGVYRISAVLTPNRGTAAGHGQRLLSVPGHKLAVGTASPTAATYLGATVALSGTTLRVTVGSGAGGVAGLQVAALRPTPARGVAVPAIPAFTTVPVTGCPPRGEPAPHWASGVWPGGAGDAASVTAFARYRGAQVQVAEVASAMSDWTDIATATDGLAAMQGFTGQLSVFVPLLPLPPSIANADHTISPGQYDADLTAVASGAHDADFTSFARNLVAYGRGNSYLRVGWEYNGNWYPWADYNPSLYVAAFRRVVSDIRAVAPGVRIEWDASYGYSQTQVPVQLAYPGDAYVDVIGVDAYDRQWFHVHDAASWALYQQAAGGLNTYLNLAKAHHKKFALPEWGLYHSEGGDNVYYIQRMHDFFVANAGILAYEAYFNATYIGAALLPAQQNPKAAKAYASLWKQAS